MALESPTKSWDKQERETKEEYGRRSADLDLNQAVTKDEGEGDEYDYQPYIEGKTDDGGNQKENYASSQIGTDRDSLAQMEMKNRPILSGSPTQRCLSPERHSSFFLGRDQSVSITNGRYDSPQKSPPRESRSLTPDRRNSPASSPLPVSPSSIRRAASPAIDTYTSHARDELPSDTNPNLPSDIRHKSSSPSPIRHKSSSPSPIKHKSSSPSPTRHKSPSPARRLSVSSAKHMAVSPIRRISVSPVNNISVSPRRHRSILTRKYKSPSPPPRRDIEPFPGKKSSPSSRRRSVDSREVSPPFKRRRYSPQENRRKSDRSRSPLGRHGVSPVYGRGYRGRSQSRSPVQEYSRRSPRARYSPRSRNSPRRRYSPRRRTPPKYRPQRRSPRRRPWSPPPNRNTGIGKPGNNLFIAGFSFDTTERDLERKFSRFGRVTDVRIVRDKRSGDSRGFGFLTLERDEDADSAIRTLDQTEWNGRIVLIEKAKTPTRY